MYSTPPAKSADRVWYFDLLRIIASFGIVVLHMTPLSAEDAVVTALPWQIMTVYKVLFRWSVPAFLMISGALFLSPGRTFSVKRLYRKSIFRILASFFFWSAFYAAVHCLLAGKGKWTFLNQFLRGHYHMWFLLTILGLYVLTPLLRRVTESRALTRYFLVLSLVFTFLLPRLIAFILLFDFPHRDVVQSANALLAQSNPLSGIHALFYYVLGHFLHTACVTPAARRAAYCAGFLGFALAAGLTLAHSASLGEASIYFCDLPSLPVLAMSTAVFLLFKHAFATLEPQGRIRRILHQLSICSFGIYLVHPFILERLALTLPASPVVLAAGALLPSLIVYALSLAVSMVLNRIPVLRKYVV